MKLSELIFIGGLAIFAAVTFVGSLDMPFTSGLTFGPGFLPLIMSVAVIAIAGLIVIRNLLRAGANPPETQPARDVWPVVIATALIAAAVLAETLGSLLLPLGLCMFIVTWHLLKRSWIVSGVSTLVTLVVIYIIFGLWLQIPLS
jgi:hypothetical protein